MYEPLQSHQAGALPSSGSDTLWPEKTRTKLESMHGILRVNPRTTSHKGPGSPLIWRQPRRQLKPITSRPRFAPASSP